MIIKDETVKLDGLQPIMRHAMRWADRVWKNLGQECVITSGTEATKDGDLIHSAGSLHYSGLALDFRTRYFDDGGYEAAKRLLVNLIILNERLTTGQFQVVRHKTHIHVEFEPNE